MNDRIKYLLVQFSSGKATDAEKKELFDWVDTASDTRVLKEHIHQLTADITLPDGVAELDSEKILYRIKQGYPSSAPEPRMYRLRSPWLRYAAAILLLVGTIAYFWNNDKKTGAPANKEMELATTIPDLPPGGNKAILVLGNDSIISLDSLPMGTLVRQGNMQISKNSNGRIIYSVAGSSNKEERVFMNTMRTPRGGQYQLALPDGTNVWLNAASSISYPTSFVTSSREVTISGEVYFEVARNKHKPFIVHTAKESVTVLGTAFNIMAYPDEPVFKTSLVEGSVKVGMQLLQPGQAYNNGKIYATNTEQDIAWKSGVFNFHELRLQQIMPQLERWYDIRVQYEGQVPQMKFYGELGRDLNLAQVLKFLEQSGLRFTINKEKLLTVKSR